MGQDDAPFTTCLYRAKDVLVTSGDSSSLVRDLELHLLSIGVRHDAFTMKCLRDGLAALAFYVVSRPRFESIGWTVGLQSPRLNLFFTGTASEGAVVGRAFHENVQPAEHNLFFSQIHRPCGEPQKSCVEVEGTDVYRIVEQYCMKSDQQLARFFHDRGRLAFVSALPDADRQWLAGVTAEAVFALEAAGELHELSENRIAFRCGCDSGRITKIVAGVYRDKLDELFRGDSVVEVECPRCGTKHRVKRKDFEA